MTKRKRQHHQNEDSQLAAVKILAGSGEEEGIPTQVGEMLDYLRVMEDAGCKLEVGGCGWRNNQNQTKFCCQNEGLFYMRVLESSEPKTCHSH